MISIVGCQVSPWWLQISWRSDQKQGVPSRGRNKTTNLRDSQRMWTAEHDRLAHRLLRTWLYNVWLSPYGKNDKFDYIYILISAHISCPCNFQEYFHRNGYERKLTWLPLYRSILSTHVYINVEDPSHIHPQLTNLYIFIYIFSFTFKVIYLYWIFQKQFSLHLISCIKI